VGCLGVEGRDADSSIDRGAGTIGGRVVTVDGAETVRAILPVVGLGTDVGTDDVRTGDC